MATLMNYCAVTDVGSTTTKAILLDYSFPVPRLAGLWSAPTTVEDPYGDVRYGVKSALLGLEKSTGIELLKDRGDSPELEFVDGVAYLSTSSAGGGLQILVIGLTLFDSASSARRAAYGAGGIILDTFAIDDRRQASQQMLTMRKLHPDMILLCGGTDGGAISGVLRMAEIMRVAKPQPKYQTSTRIPTLFAGNQAAIPMIKEMISKDFDLHILPNLRPTMNAENLQPTQAMIQQLFMENVMEHAPGYAELKKTVSSPIVPTPSGVMKSLGIIARQDKRNVFAFDIGGATTDVFSQVNGHFQRTVSANLGLSYSALNVMKESGIPNLARWLPGDVTEDTLRDYVANKCMRPTSLPQTRQECLIEQALTREALRIALEQHREMHFNTAKIGYLEKIVDNDADPFDQKFNYQHYEEQYWFHESDIDLIIAAGGIFAHTPDPLESAMMVIDAIRPKGITEIAVDKDFTTPHTGVLSDTDPKAAESLLRDSCLQKLAVHIAPVFPKGQGKGKLEMEITQDGSTRRISSETGNLIVIPAGKKSIRLHASGKVYLSLTGRDEQIDTDLPLVFDTRSGNLTATYGPMIQHTPTAAMDNARAPEARISPIAPRTRDILLPYKGEIRFNPGDPVNPADVVAVNRFNPPRLFIVDGFSRFGTLSKQTIAASLRIQPGDQVDSDQFVAELPDDPGLPKYLRHNRKIISPVRGKVEYIDPATGLMVLSEIQDYSLKPVSVNLAEGLGLKARRVGRYLSKQKGDFVYRGDPLASRKEQGPDGPIYRFVKSPTSGTIVALDEETGVMTIKYTNSPMEFHAHVPGRVGAVEEGRSISITYSAARLNGIIGLGKDRSGKLSVLQRGESIYGRDLKGGVLVCAYPPGLSDMKLFTSAGISALICNSIAEKVLADFLETELGVINTGNEILPFSVLVLGDFSTGDMPEGLLNSLISHSGRHCLVSPHTRIRAGVVRPYADLFG